MKTTTEKNILLVSLLIFIFHINPVFSQTTFDADNFKLFLENNKTLTAVELINKNQPQTEYYANRLRPTNLEIIPWFDSIDAKYQLTGYEKELLKHNHFMVTERLRKNSWAYSFIDIYSKDLPLFISSDFILYTLHSSYDAILMHLEHKILEPNLQELLKSMYNSFNTLYDKYSDDNRLITSLEDVDLYISVAYSLALGDEILPQFSDKDAYYTIMEAIQAEQLTTLNLFTDKKERKIDFSQFKPRGHYTKRIPKENETTTLENYFRTMMWLGRIDFLLTAPPENPWEENWTKNELRRMQQSALLLNELLHSCGNRSLYETHENIIEFMVGPADNLTPDELSYLSDSLLDSPEMLFDENTYDVFQQALNSSDDYGQKIMSNFFYVDPFSSDPESLPVSYKLFGQKFLLDSYIFAHVVYDRIVWNGKKIHRGMPVPLDILSVLGNENAMALMKDEMKKYHYAYKINELKEITAYYDENFWQQSLYNVWLSSIKELNPSSQTENLPYFMQTTAWHHEKLNTQLTSWAELRHDNILYGKQSYTGATGCSFPYTYVEPQPACYQRIHLFSQKSATFFNDVLGGGNSVSEFFDRYGEIIGILKTISEKELSGTKLNEQEMTFLKTMINEFMASGPGITGWYNDLFFDPREALLESFIVADVHTQPTDEAGNLVGNVLHAGNGYIDQGVFLAPNPVNPDQLMAFTGPVSSFRYEITNNFQRLNDDEWTEKFFMHENLPQRPDWVNVYLASSEGEALPEGRKLEGKTYTKTDTKIEVQKNNAVDYLLAFPNPANDIFHLRFILNNRSDIHIKLFDFNGQLIKDICHEMFLPGEHDVRVNISGLPEKTYIVSFNAGDKIFMKKIHIE